jgi:hypothetical protein
VTFSSLLQQKVTVKQNKNSNNNSSSSNNNNGDHEDGCHDQFHPRTSIFYIDGR